MNGSWLFINSIVLEGDARLQRGRDDLDVSVVEVHAAQVELDQRGAMPLDRGGQQDRVF